MNSMVRWLSGAAVLLAAFSAAATPADDAVEAGNRARRASQFAEAESDYAKALEERPGDAEILNQLALVQGFQAHYDQALASILKAVAAAPQDLDILLTKARVLAWMQRYGEAETDLARILTARPDDADALDLRGRVALYQNRPAAARESFSAALKRDPQNLDAVLGLGDAARAQGHETEAHTFYLRAKEIDPGSGDVAERLRPQEKLPLWQLDTSGTQSWLTHTTLADWSDQSLRLTRTLHPGTAVWAGVEHARRFGLNDVQLSAGAATSLADGIGAEVDLGVTPDAKFLPSWLGAVSLSGRVLEGTFALVDGSLRHYATGTVKGFNLGVDQYVFDGRLELTGKFINSIDPAGKHLTGWSTLAAVTPVDWLKLRAGYSSAPESDLGVVADTRGWSLGAAFDLTKRLTLRVDYVNENRVGSYRRQDLTAGVSLKF